jgi:hypothetical protein
VSQPTLLYKPSESANTGFLPSFLPTLQRKDTFPRHEDYKSTLVSERDGKGGPEALVFLMPFSLSTPLRLFHLLRVGVNRPTCSNLRYDPALIEPFVIGIPSMHVCIDYLPEMLDQPVTFLLH